MMRISTIPAFPRTHTLSRVVAAVLFCVIATAFPGCAARSPENAEKSVITGPIEFYRGPLNHLSAVRDGTCPMYPSCSAYAKTAFEKHGPLLGWTMTFDRLIRCGRDETNHAKEIYVNERWRYHDPVSHNDFWWHERH